MSLGPLDFSPERGNARLKLLDRKRVEIIAGKRIQGIARPTRESLVGLHGVNVDPHGHRVNKDFGAFHDTGEGDGRNDRDS